MTPDELKVAVLSVKRWSRGDQRAPNKPLMMVYALTKYSQGHEQMFSFEEVEHDVNELLRKFGPSRKSYHSLYPFWRLKNDGFWQLNNAEKCLPRKSNTDPPKSELVKYRVTAGFNDDAYLILKDNTQLVIDLIESILIQNFPNSIVSDLSMYLGLERTISETSKRDPNFRREVLRAYNYQCAVCGYDLRMDDVSVGLEAAHIKWKQFNGPCAVSNGMALCTIHHKAFDKGAISFTDDLRLMLSPALNGGRLVDKLFHEFGGSQINYPKLSKLMPSSKWIEWHFSEVFVSDF